MAKPKLKKRLVIRISEPFVSRLKLIAARDGRSLSNFARKALADAAAARESLRP